MTYSANQKPSGLDAAGSPPVGADLYVGQVGGSVVKFTHTQLMDAVLSLLGDTDVTLAADSDLLFATQKAVKAYVDGSVPLIPLGIACGDETTPTTAGANVAKFRNPYPTAFNVVGAFASLSTAQSSGSIFTVDMNEGGTTILSTKITIDNGETVGGTSGAGSATAAVISDGSIAAFAEIEVDVDQVGDGTAAGLKVWVLGYPS